MPNVGMHFYSGSKYHFVCTSKTPMEDIVDCQVWIPFQGKLYFLHKSVFDETLGKTRTWYPKSVKIRKMTSKLLRVGFVGYLDEISTSIYTFLYDEKISLMDNFSLYSARRFCHLRTEFSTESPLVEENEVDRKLKIK